jgi:hypothetical protein
MFAVRREQAEPAKMQTKPSKGEGIFVIRSETSQWVGPPLI